MQQKVIELLEKVTIEDFADWVQAQPSDQEIENYSNGVSSWENCAIGSFLKQFFEYDDAVWKELFIEVNRQKYFERKNEHFAFQLCHGFSLKLGAVDLKMYDNIKRAYYKTYGELQHHTKDYLS